MEQATQPTYRRRRELIWPAFQARLILIFTAVGILGVFVQVLLVDYSLQRILSSLNDVNVEAFLGARDLILGSVVLGFLTVLPLLFGIGILVTFRIAGPVHRFETYLRRIAKGEETGPCTLRERDEFHVLCTRINEAVSYLRDRARSAAPAASADEGPHVSVSSEDAAFVGSPSDRRAA